MFPETMSIVEKLTNGFGLTILGMGVVFAVLAVLSFALDGLRVLLADKAPPPVPEKIDENRDNEVLMAVITAAIAAFTEKSEDTLIVKSIRRRPQTEPGWGAVGRQQQMADRL